VAELEAQVKPLETRLAQLEIQNADLSSANHQLEIEVAALQESERILQAFNPLVQDIGKLLAGDDLTQTEIANRHQTSESTVSRLKGQLNGKLGG
jgi:DNA-directed RNA polymerase specialized sigma subunit